MRFAPLARCPRLAVGLAFLLAATTAPAARATVLDPGFVQSEFVNNPAGLAYATGLAWAPDGSNRLFVIRKFGQVQVIKNGGLLATPFHTFSPLYTNSECGVIGMCFDPNFLVNHYVYFFVTVSGGEQQILRLTDSNDVGTGKTTIIPGLATNGQNHDGGGLGFGYDGKLYWSIGDNGIKRGVDNDLSSSAAKIGRANPDGTVPNDNPFNDGAAGPNHDYTWARGFRNPFTLTFQPGTGRLFVNDVGSNGGAGQTNPSSGPGYEQVFDVTRGADAGYDDWEGNQDLHPTGVRDPNYPFSRLVLPVIQYKTNGAEGAYPQTANLAAANTGAVRRGNIATFTTTAAHPYRVGEAVTVSGVADNSFNGEVLVRGFTANRLAFTAFQPGADADSGGGSAVSRYLGGSITGGCFYDSTAFPAAYRGNFFFGDYNSQLLMRAGFDANRRVSSLVRFAANVPGIVDVATGPDGALYGIGADGAGVIYRLATTDTAQNLVVHPTAFAFPEGGAGVFTVRLAQPPVGNVTVLVARTAGSAGVGITSGATLTFTPADHATPKPVFLSAARDGDLANSGATFTVSSPGLPSYAVDVTAIDTDEPDLVVSTSNLLMTEGVDGSFTVRLARAPAANVTVSVARTAGEDSIYVKAGSSLNFTPANFATPQTVTVVAPADANTRASAATLTVSAPGQTSREVQVAARDDDPAAPAFTSTPVLNAVQGAAYTYDANATGNPAPTFSFAGNPPAGMSLDAATGVLAWTPGTVGSFPVTLQAANGVNPAAAQSFIVTVAADRPPVASLVRPADGETVSGAGAEFYGNGLDDVSTVRAEFSVDNVLASTDANNTNHFHFGGEHLRWDTTALTDGPHTLRFTVFDTRGQSAFQEVRVLVANGIDAWKRQHFGPDPDPAVAGDDRDPNGNGIPNLLEYALNIPPERAGNAGLPVLGRQNVDGADYLTLTFTRVKWATDVSYRVELATDLTLGNWLGVYPGDPTNYPVSILDNMPAYGLQTVTVRDHQPLDAGGGGSRFLRLRVSRP